MMAPRDGGGTAMHWRLLAFALAWVLVAPAAWAQVDEDGLVRARNFPLEQVGYVLFDPATGERLAAGRPDQGFIPASVAKVPTMVAALGILGPGYQPRTDVWIDGEISGGVLVGDLYLRGYGDPFLDTDSLIAIAQQVKAAGVDRVAGAFYYDVSWLPNVRQITAQQPEVASYNPGVSALSINFNRVSLGWQPGGGGLEFDLAAYADRSVVPVDWISYANGGALGAVLDYQERGDGGDHWLYTGNLEGEGRVWLPVRNAAFHAAMAFRAVAADQGVQLARPVQRITPATARTLVSHAGEPLATICAGVLEHSNNLAAELTGLIAARTNSGSAVASLEHAARLNTAWLQTRITDVNWAGYDMINHSGLSSETRVSPAQMAAILNYANRPDTPDLNGLLPSIQWGSWLNQDADPGAATIAVRAKTGTMAYAVGLAGFLDTASGRTLGFAIFVSDIAKRQAMDASLNMRDSSIPPEARAWLNRARELERSIIAAWALRY